MTGNDKTLIRMVNALLHGDTIEATDYTNKRFGYVNAGGRVYAIHDRALDSWYFTKADSPIEAYYRAVDPDAAQELLEREGDAYKP